MLIVGVQRSGGSFETKEKTVINYDNVYVHAVSGEKDKKPTNCDFFTGKTVEKYKIKVEDFLESFDDLKNPFEESKGLDVVPVYNQYGKVTGFMRQR